MLALGLEKNVFFVGNVSGEDLYSYYSLCDLFVLPSTGEGFGIVFLEAMYHKKACVGADAAAIPEVVSNRETGILCDVNNQDLLVDSIVELLKDEKMSKTFGVAGYQKYQKEFSFEKFQEKLEKILCS